MHGVATAESCGVARRPLMSSGRLTGCATFRVSVAQCAVVELHRYNWRNTALEPELATLGGRIRVLPIFYLSARYPKVDQPKAADCTHFALPGLPDTWSHLLLPPRHSSRCSHGEGRRQGPPYQARDRMVSFWNVHIGMHT